MREAPSVVNALECVNERIHKAIQEREKLCAVPEIKYICVVNVSKFHDQQKTMRDKRSEEHGRQQYENFHQSVFFSYFLSRIDSFAFITAYGFLEVYAIDDTKVASCNYYEGDDKGNCQQEVNVEHHLVVRSAKATIAIRISIGHDEYRCH